MVDVKRRYEPTFFVTMDHGTVNMTMEMNPDHGHGMAMPAVFTTGTHITLFFNSWRTSSLTSYLLALLLLFVLALFNRFLGVLKFQLDAKIQTLVPDVPVIAPPPASIRYPSIPKDHASPLPRYVKNHNAHDDSNHFPPPFSHTHSSEWNDLISGRSVKPQGPNTRFVRMLSGLRTSRELWTWRRSLCSLLEGARALIGYMLMLAVMTFNTGVLCAVIGGIVVGELVLGQYAQGSGWQDGACHDG